MLLTFLKYSCVYYKSLVYCVFFPDVAHLLFSKIYLFFVREIYYGNLFEINGVFMKVDRMKHNN